jgi:hypothetical protein
MLLRIKGNNAIFMRATTPYWRWQGCLHTNNGNNAIIMRVTISTITTAKMPAHWWQQCHHDEGNNSSSTISNEGNDTSLITAEMPAHRQQQQCHRDKSNNHHCDNGKDACTSMAMMPLWQGWWYQVNVSYVQACEPVCQPYKPLL